MHARGLDDVCSCISLLQFGRGDPTSLSYKLGHNSAEKVLVFRKRSTMFWTPFAVKSAKMTWVRRQSGLVK